MFCNFKESASAVFLKGKAGPYCPFYSLSLTAKRRREIEMIREIWRAADFIPISNGGFCRTYSCWIYDVCSKGDVSKFTKLWF